MKCIVCGKLFNEELVNHLCSACYQKFTEFAQKYGQDMELILGNIKTCPLDDLRMFLSLHKRATHLSENFRRYNFEGAQAIVNAYPIYDLNKRFFEYVDAFVSQLNALTFPDQMLAISNQLNYLEAIRIDYSYTNKDIDIIIKTLENRKKALVNEQF